MTRQNTEDTGLEETFEAAVQAQSTALTIDLRQYLHHLDESDASDDEKLQLLSVIYSIGLTFVDMGFNIDPYHDDSRQGSAPALHLIEDFNT